MLDWGKIRKDAAELGRFALWFATLVVVWLIAVGKLPL